MALFQQFKTVGSLLRQPNINSFLFGSSPGASCLKGLRLIHTQPSPPFYVQEGIPGFLSPQSLRMHYNKIHWNSVQKLNKLTDSEATSRHFGLSPEVIIRMTAEDRSQAHLFNAAADFWNHTFFWNCLSPNGPVSPSSAISKELEAWLKIHFGSSQRMIEKFSEGALSTVGSGWTWLISASGQFQIINTPLSGCPVAFGPSVYPLLCLDMWEHSYVLDYGASPTARVNYVNNFWTVVNWKFLEDNIAIATRETPEDYPLVFDDIGVFYQRLR